MMLVHADAVEAALLGEFKLIEVLVVDGVPSFRVVQTVVDVDPDAAVLLLKVVRQVRPGHEVEPVELHACPLPVFGPMLRQAESIPRAVRAVGNGRGLTVLYDGPR